jgi:hypothetical protein
VRPRLPTADALGYPLSLAPRADFINEPLTQDTSNFLRVESRRERRWLPCGARPRSRDVECRMGRVRGTAGKWARACVADARWCMSFSIRIRWLVGLGEAWQDSLASESSEGQGHELDSGRTSAVCLR